MKWFQRLRMIEYRKGNLFSAYSTPAIIVHGCNAQGVMGSGFAKQFKEEFPEAYLQYLNQYSYSLGQVIAMDYGDLTVCSAITQTFYGRDASVRYVDYLAVQTALGKVVSLAEGRPIYMPFIGGGLANGDRRILAEIFEGVFQDSIAYVYTLD